MKVFCRSLLRDVKLHMSVKGFNDFFFSPLFLTVLFLIKNTVSSTTQLHLNLPLLTT
uniref:Uncharacterized protein n=1 Tax=Octopus bimaculoides TaxID=37653 RepID=A0A0L8FH91_OCTBM